MFRRIFLIISVLFLALALVSCASETEIPEQPTAQSTNTPALAAPTEEPTQEPTADTSAMADDRIIFEQLGMSLEVPDGLFVIKEPIAKPDDPGKMQTYTFFIQNYRPEEGPGEDSFQLYGHLQFDLDPTTWEDYASEVLGSEMYAYTLEIEVNGLPGIDSQFTGQRNRYVYHFVLDGHVLTMAVADPTEENKVLADQIINTLEFTPGSMTDAIVVE